MKRYGLILFIVTLALGFLVLALAIGQTAKADSRTVTQSITQIPLGKSEEECTGENLLVNPGFEGQYSTYMYPEPGHIDCGLTGQVSTICNRAQMPEGWHPRWQKDGEPPPIDYFVAPEYLPSTPDQVNPDRVFSGEKSLHYFSFWSQHESAVFQQIAVEPGANYCFSVWGHAWSDRLDDDYYSATPDRPIDDGLLYQRVGIDPTGGTVYTASTVIWGDERKQSDLGGLFKIEAEASSPTMTVFISSRSDFPVKHNEAYWDQAAFTQASQVMRVSPGSVTWMKALSPTAQLTRTVNVSITGGVSWTAVLDTGTLSPTVSTLAGSAGDDITISISTTNYMTGTYTATLTISAYLTDTVNSPTVVPITLFHVPEVWQTFLPFVSKP
jgi:hypothetical protein